jgi:hypothetical protein
VNWTHVIFGVALILISVGLLFVFALPPRSRPRVVLRPNQAFQHLRRAIGLSVENGTRMHVSIGTASIISPNNPSALIGLSTLERVSMISSVSDRPTVATSGDGTLAILSQDTTRAAYRRANCPEQFDPTQARLTGPTPFSYIAGTLPVIADERVSTNILVGNFGPEAALLADASERSGGFLMGASDSVPAQAALYATASEPLIGEELFAIPAYLKAGPTHEAGLRAQDVLRWIIAAGLVIGSLLALVGIL